MTAIVSTNPRGVTSVRYVIPNDLPDAQMRIAQRKAQLRKLGHSKIYTK